jgi:hypothetical protein
MTILTLEQFKNSAFVENLICELCKGVLNSPVVGETGQSFCKECTTDKTNCVIVFPSGNATNPDQIVQNLTLTKFINSLEIKCQNFKDTCEWEGIVLNQEEHLKTCQFNNIECSIDRCDKVLKRFELEAHLQVCEKRPSPCSDCEINHPLDLLSDHLLNCPKVKITCFTGCGKTCSRDQLHGHLQNYCPLKISNCIFREAGCLYQDFEHKLDAHYKEYVQYHLKIQGEQISSQETFFNDSLSNVVDVIQATNDSAAKLEVLNNLISDYQRRKSPSIPIFNVISQCETLEITNSGELAKSVNSENLQFASLDFAMTPFRRFTFRLENQSTESLRDNLFSIGFANTQIPKEESIENFYKNPSAEYLFIGSDNKQIKKNQEKSEPEHTEIKLFFKATDTISFYSLLDKNTIVFENISQKINLEVHFETAKTPLYPYIIIGPGSEVAIKDFLKLNDQNEDQASTNNS